MKERLNITEVVSTMGFILEEEAQGVDCTALRNEIAPIINAPTFTHEYTDGFVVSKCGRCNLMAGIIYDNQELKDLSKIEVQHRCNGKIKSK
jgi:aminopeptidase C